MAGTLTANWWQYARYVRNIARNSRITNPADAFLTSVRTYVVYFWDSSLQTGTRPWLADKFDRLSVSAVEGYDGDASVEPAPVLVKMLLAIAVDLKQHPITDAEKAQTDILIAAASNRQLGTGPYFGGVSGDGKVS